MTFPAGRGRTGVLVLASDEGGVTEPGGGFGVRIMV